MIAPIAIDAELDVRQRKAIARALDLLGAALAGHNHAWTDEERDAYETAVSCLTSFDCKETG